MIGSILNIINKFIPDEDEARKAAVQLEKEYTKQMEMQASIIQQEASQEGITSKWRPYTMMMFLFMIVVHWIMYDIIPYMRTAFDWDFWTPIDVGFTDGYLELIKLGLGGYIGGRSVEKIARIWKGK